jgi:hypothetical protein
LSSIIKCGKFESSSEFGNTNSNIASLNSSVKRLKITESFSILVYGPHFLVDADLVSSLTAVNDHHGEFHGTVLFGEDSMGLEWGDGLGDGNV